MATNLERMQAMMEEICCAICRDVAERSFLLDAKPLA